MRVKNLKQKSIWVIFTAVVLSVSVFFFNNFFWLKTGSEKIVVIEKNQPEEIIEKLKDEGIVSNPLAENLIRFFLRFKKIEPGGYVLKANQGAVSLYSSLNNPDYSSIVLINGMRKEEVVEKLSKNLNWNEKERSEFLSLYPICSFSFGEGFYYPEKYLLPKSSEPSIVTLIMKQKFEERFKEIVEEKGLNFESIDLNKIVTIASMIERETGGVHDMKLISGIIHNRLEKNMPLQIDATLQYLRGSSQNRWWPRVRLSDKSIDSDYNTYKRKGLPPAPIASPGKAALAAAMTPMKTDCLYYLHDKNGIIHCSSDYEGHLQNIETYLR